MSVGAVCVELIPKPEHLLEGSRCNGSERIELTVLYLSEEPIELRVVRHGALQMVPGRRDRDRENLRGNVLAAPRLELPGRLEVCAMGIDLLEQRLDSLVAKRLGEDDRRLPVALRLRARACRMSVAIPSACGWSHLLTTTTSGISMIPAFSAWHESPDPGRSTSTTVSAIESTPTSL